MRRDALLGSEKIKVIRTPVQAPNANAHIEHYTYARERKEGTPGLFSDAAMRRRLEASLGDRRRLVRGPVRRRLGGRVRRVRLDVRASLIAGTALSTTSLVVVYSGAAWAARSLTRQSGFGRSSLHNVAQLRVGVPRLG